MEKFFKKNFSTILLVCIFILGLCLLLYPSFSDYWNSFHQTKAIAAYADKVAELDTSETDKLWEDAYRYNEKLTKQGENKWNLSEEEQEEYERVLDVSGTGIMGYIDIPSIQLTLPIYHGVDESVLQIAIGHIPGTALPIGGTGTHCVISGHRGLPSAKLFTNLDQLVEGDLFMLNVLDQTFTYEVDQILIVEPEDLSALSIDKEKDLCTLVTCTPYGVNSHRLLVRGHRVENEKDTIQVTADATLIEPILVAPAIAIPILFILLVWVFIYTRKRK